MKEKSREAIKKVIGDNWVSKKKLKCILKQSKSCSEIATSLENLVKNG